MPGMTSRTVVLDEHAIERLCAGLKLLRAQAVAIAQASTSLLPVRRVAELQREGIDADIKALSVAKRVMIEVPEAPGSDG